MPLSHTFLILQTCLHMNHKISEAEAYTSSNTEILDVEGVKKKLLSVPYVKEKINEMVMDP